MRVSTNVDNADERPHSTGRRRAGHRLATGAIQAKKSTGKAWWGAGVRTVLDDE